MLKSIFTNKDPYKRNVKGHVLVILQKAKLYLYILIMRLGFFLANKVMIAWAALCLSVHARIGAKVFNCKYFSIHFQDYLAIDWFVLLCIIYRSFTNSLTVNYDVETYCRLGN